MCKPGHKDEMDKFSNSPSGIKVWFRSRQPGKRWELLEEPNWCIYNHYIVDDVYAELRKQFIDDRREIQVRDKYTNEWRDTVTDTLNRFDSNIKRGIKYRIKPKTISGSSESMNIW